MSLAFIPPISKAEAEAFIRTRDHDEIQKYVSEIDRRLRSGWVGNPIRVSTGQSHVPAHVVEKVTEIVESLGWSVTYRTGGSDQRDGAYPGSFTIA